MHAPLAADELERIARNVSRYPLGEPPANEARPLIFRPVYDLLSEVQPVRWLLPGLLEQRTLTLIAGRRGSFKSFLLLHWLLTLATRRRAVFLVSAEGAGLGRRVEAWLKVHASDMRPDSLPLYVHEQRVNFNDPVCLTAVRAAIEESAMTPDVLAIDTLSKNSGALDENSNSDVKAFIGRLDLELRQPLKLAVAIVAHTGHSDTSRVRGASALEADTDAALIVNRAGVDRVVTVKRDRFKDAPELPPLIYQADVLDLGRLDDNGQAVSSLVMREAEGEARAAGDREPTGRAQRDILRALRNQQRAAPAARVWTVEELRRLGRDLGQVRSTAHSAVDALLCSGLLVPTIGGHRLADAPV